MKTSIALSIFLVLVCAASGLAQNNRRNQTSGGVLNVPEHPQAVGESGIAWYTTWETGLAEATRSNRPIFFMSAATTCSGVSGVF